MKHGVSSLSRLMDAGRWDAGFHLTIQSLEQDGSLDLARKILSEMAGSSDENEIVKKASEIMSVIPFEIRAKSASAFCRGSYAGTPSGSMIDRTIEEYPLAVVAVAFRDHQADVALRRIAEEAMASLALVDGMGKMFRGKSKL